MLVMQLFKCDTHPHTAPKRQRKECLDDDEDDDEITSPIAKTRNANLDMRQRMGQSINLV